MRQIFICKNIKMQFNIVDATESNIGTAADFDGTSDVKIKLFTTIKTTSFVQAAIKKLIGIAP